jgi:molybdopterin-guanine dinucleotide biosynthesis protein A
MIMQESCAIVLAGGRSKRFGSDKALAPFHGEPLIAHVLRGLRALDFAQIVIVAKEPERYAQFDTELARDGSELQTPLAGLEAGLRASRHDRVFACAADMPFAADGRLILALLDAAEEGVAFPRCHGQLQPLCGAYSLWPALPRVTRLLQSGAVGPRALPATIIEWDDERPFLDADTPEALVALEAS